MNWKALLAVFIVVGILAVFMLTDAGKKYTQFFSTKVGSFLSSLLSMPAGESFSFSMEASKPAFYGQSYSITNASLLVSGICQSSIRLGSTVMEVAGKRCSIDARQALGSFEYTVGNSVKFTGTTDMLLIDGYPLIPADKPFDVSFEVIPMDDFSLSGFSQDRINLKSVSGSIDGWKGETHLSIANLASEELTIANFYGDMKLSGESILLIGVASSVRGRSFSW